MLSTINASSSGSAIASSEPNAMNSTTAAATMPISSLALAPGCAAKTWPPASHLQLCGSRGPCRDHHRVCGGRRDPAPVRVVERHRGVCGASVPETCRAPCGVS